MISDKEIIDYLKKEKDNLRKKLDNEKKEELASWNWHRKRKKDSNPVYSTIRGRKKC